MNGRGQLPYYPGLLRLLTMGSGLALVCSTAMAAETPAQQAAPPEELLVTATHLPRATQDVAGTVSVISAQELERQMAEDMADLTRFQPGLNMDSSSRGGDQGFVIRGIGGNRVLTVIDGIRSNDIYAAGPSSYGKDLFEVDDLKAVEIIRGPASVLYGADAMGGAVLLRTRDPADYLRDGSRSALQVRTSTASANDLNKVGLSWAIQGDTLGSVLQYTRREFGERDVSGSGRLNPQDGHSDSLFWKGVWQPAPAHRLSVTADVSDETVDTRLDGDLGGSVSRSAGEDRSERMRLSLTHDWTLDSLFADTLRTQIHAQRTDAQQYTQQSLTSYAFVNPRNPSSFAGTPAARFSDFEFNQDTVSASLLLTKSFAMADTDHVLIYGLSHEFTDTERPRDRCDTQLSTGTVSCAIPSYPMAPPEVFPNKTFPDTRTIRTGLFIQDEIRLPGDRLVLIPGIRYDRYAMDPRPDALLNGSGNIADYGGFTIGDVDEHEVSLNLGLLYELNSQLSFFVQYAEGFRPPNFDESNQAFVNLGHGYATIPNPDLEAEYSKGTEIGLRGSVGTLDASLALYSNRYDNFIESQMVGSANGVNFFQDANIGKAHIYGTEASLDWSISSEFQLRGSVALSRGRDERNDTWLDSVDPLTAVIGLRYQPLGSNWDVEGLATLVDGQERTSSPELAQSDDYQVVDIIAHYRFNDTASLRLGIFNVFDTRYARWNSISGLAATDQRKLANAQAPGINFRAGFTLKL